MARNRKRKKRGDEDAIDTSAWMVTFSDLLTLLMTFFVLLLTMSSMDTKALRSMFSTFAGAANVLGFADLSPIEKIQVVQPKLLPRDIQKILSQVMKEYAEGNLDFALNNTAISILAKKNSVFITFPEKILFEMGSYTLKKETFPILKEIGELIKQTDYFIRIEGHTDDIISPSDDTVLNWKLSAMRAASVFKFFLNKEIPADRLFAAGYGNLKPIFSKKEKKFRYKNRRVDIILERVTL